jgi:hypothetical protein
LAAAIHPMDSITAVGIRRMAMATVVGARPGAVAAASRLQRRATSAAAEGTLAVDMVVEAEVTQVGTESTTENPKANQ